MKSPLIALCEREEPLSKTHVRLIKSRIQLVSSTGGFGPPHPDRGHERHRFKNPTPLHPELPERSRIRMRAETCLTGGTCLPAFACGETLLPPVSLDCSQNPPCSKTNPEADKPLALKSRGVVEFTAAEGLVTRNKSSNPVFR